MAKCIYGLRQTILGLLVYFLMALSVVQFK